MPEVKQVFKKKKNLFSRMAMLVIPMICILLLLSQTAFAQNTYVITDGSRVLVHTTYATDPIAVLDEAGLALDEDDTYTTQRGDGISEITVQRGEGITTESTSRIVRTTETYTKTINHDVTYCNDSSLPAGQQVVLTKGENGQMSCTASVVYEDGQEISRDVLTQTIIEQPISELIAVGTGEDVKPVASAASDTPVIGDGMITLPTGEVLRYTDSMTVWATAYTCEGYDGITATGTRAREGAIAVDPSVIPYGTRMFIVANDGSCIYGVATAEDCGDPDFICDNRVDLYFDTLEECIRFGYRDCTVYFLGETEIERIYMGY